MLYFWTGVRSPSLPPLFFILATFYLYASAVDPKFSYQYYLDFALNRGSFSPNATNLSIKAKDVSYDISFNAPMIDFSATDTNLAKNGSALEFGGIVSMIVDYKDPYTTSVPGDSAVLKMDKFNLNTAAKLSPDLNFVSIKDPNGSNLYDKYTFNEAEARKLSDSSRYTFFVREGAGVQMLGHLTQGADKIASNDLYHTGGFTYFSDIDNNPFALRFENYDWQDNFNRFAFSSSAAPGDSGSALYVYDNLDKKWYMIGVLSSSDCAGNDNNLCSIDVYSVVNNALVNEFKDDKSIKLGAGKYIFNSSLLNSNMQDMGAITINDNLAVSLYWESVFNKNKFNDRLAAMKDSKDIYFSDLGVLSLEKNIDLGAGGLIFADNANWHIESNDFWFVHAGIYTGLNSLVIYDVKTLDNEFLHKVGEGRLIITSSSPNSGLRVGAGAVDLESDFLSFKDRLLSFQGHLVLHAYVDENTKSKLDSMGVGEGVFTSPTTFTQADWEDRVFKLKELSLENASFSLARNASFMGQLSSINSSIVLGSKELYIDKKDGENVSTKISSGNNSALGNPSYTAGNTMRFEQDLLKGQSLNTGVKFIGKLELYNSKASIDNVDIQADIKAHSGTNDISVLNSNIKGNIENLSSLNLRLSNTTFYGDIKNTNELELSSNTYINGSILTKTLKATDSIFTLDIDIAQQSTQSISSTQNSEGKNNTLRLNFTSFANENLQSLVLASLKDPSMQINEDFFKVEKISAGFSRYLPNLIFERKDDEAQWSLEKTDNSYFNKAPNTETINKSNALFNQVLLSYVIEWNNLQKRMGELRENPNSVGTWMRSFGGGNSDSIYKGTFFELQLGSDYRFELDYADLYLGTMLNYTQNDIKGNELKADSKGYWLGTYASLLFANEAYLDTVLRYVYKKHSVNASFIPDFQNSPLNDSSGANTFLFSIEAVHRFYLQSFFNYDFLKDFYVEPQLELIAGHLQGMQWQNETVSLELLSSNTLSIKPALFFGKRFFLKDRTRNSLNDSLSLRLGFAQNFDLLRYGDRILSDQSSSTRYKGLRDKRLSVSLGTDYILNDNFRLALEFERSFFGYLNIDYKANANLRFSF